jgi:hypothetical protein
MVVFFAASAAIDSAKVVNKINIKAVNTFFITFSL